MVSLPQPAAWTAPLPKASAPPEMAIYQLPTGSYQTRAALAFSGGAWRDTRHFAASAVLVRHPRGDVLIDAGFGSEVQAHRATLSRFERAPHRLTRTAREQLEANGYHLDQLIGVIPTHSHWDHVSGLGDLHVPIWMNSAELQYAAEDPHARAYRMVSAGHRIHEYSFDGPPYLGFASSYDVHGDGSVVIVLAGGHTTGSVILFVALPSGKRYAFIGDLTWQLDGIRRRVERPWLLRKLADSDSTQVRENLLRMIALADLLQIVPAHDSAAYDGIPTLAARPTAVPTSEVA